MEITLKNGMVALIDDADFPLIAGINWGAARNGRTFYATHWKRVSPKDACLVLMHRVILGARPGEFVDHINHNGLDNRRSNLRLCTHQENMRNRQKNKTSNHAFRGIQMDVRLDMRKVYRARIRVDGKRRNGHWVGTEIEAAREYDSMAKEFYGEFANLNFPESNH